MLKRHPKSHEFIRMLEERRLWKIAWETKGIIDEKTKVIIDLFSSPKFRESLEHTIADLAQINERYLVIDVPTLPNIPYRHWIESEPMKIPVLVSSGKERKIISLDNISPFVKAIQGFFYAIRVYTLSKYRDAVRKATLKALSEYAPIKTEEMYV